MKPTLFFGVLLLAVLSGAIAGILAVHTVTPLVEPVPVEPAPIAGVLAPTTVTPASRGEPIDAQIERLSGDIEELRAEVARLRAGATRSPAVEPARITTPGEVDQAAFVAQHKAAILEVIEADREAQARKRAEEQAQRESALLFARAERAAQELGLTLEQQKSLADVYALEQAQIEELRASMREQGGPRGNPELARRMLEDVRAWRSAELATRFGPETAEKISALDDQRRRGAGVRRGGRSDRGPGAGGPEVPGGTGSSDR